MLIGARPEGRKELVGFTDDARERAQDRGDLLLDLKRRGLDALRRLDIADGAFGFWKAAGEVLPKTRARRGWMHKTASDDEDGAPWCDALQVILSENGFGFGFDSLLKPVG